MNLINFKSNKITKNRNKKNNKWHSYKIIKTFPFIKIITKIIPRFNMTRIIRK